MRTGQLEGHRWKLCHTLGARDSRFPKAVLACRAASQLRPRQGCLYAQWVDGQPSGKMEVGTPLPARGSRGLGPALMAALEVLEERSFREEQLWSTKAEDNTHPQLRPPGKGPGAPTRLFSK